MTNAQPQVDIFCDGACLGNPGPGGWAALLRSRQHEKLISGNEPHTTNNRMELTAAIEGIRAIKRSANVVVYSDSQYVVRGMNEWVGGWMARGWKNSAKKLVENVDLWQTLTALSAKHQVRWVWVKGHAGHPENERVDQAAREAAEQLRR